MMWGSSLDDEDKELPAHKPELNGYAAQLEKHKNGGGLHSDIAHYSANGYVGKKRLTPSTPRNRAGWVYLLAVPNSPGLYKIGRASNPENRLRTFNVKLPFPVSYEHLIQTGDCYALETMLHKLFAEQRIGGEFFNLSPADVMIIKNMSGN